MLDLLRRWLRTYFSDPQAAILGLMLVLGFAAVITLGHMLAPVFAGIIIAYLLEAPVAAMARRRVPRLLAVIVVFSLFLAFLAFLLFVLVPLLSREVSQLAQELPNMIAKWQQTLLLLPKRHPNFISGEQVNEVMAALRSAVTTLGQTLLSLSLASLTPFLTLLVYLVLLPVLVFFFLKDKEQILGWVARRLPRERGVAAQVWVEVDHQIGNYVRGKFVEVLIVGGACFVAFAVLGINYAMLLAALVGLSVIIPYVGAVVVTVPVELIAFFQWGWSAPFMYLTVSYTVIQLLDGNLVVPWLFSEAVNLHPIAIITAVLFFGGLWGFWGVFFAIPLATLFKAVVTAWPRSGGEAPASGEGRSG